MENFKTELCITASTFHFFSSLGIPLWELHAKMNFSMHEKMQENWRKAKNWGKETLLSIAVESTVPPMLQDVKLLREERVLKFSKAARVKCTPLLECL